MDSRKIWKFSLIFLMIGLVPFSASVSEVDVLLVADGHRLSGYATSDYTDDMFLDSYKESLNSVQGVNVTVYETNATNPDGTEAPIEERRGPSSEYMSKFDAVVWYTLADYDAGSDQTEPTLYDKDVQRLKQYLNSGGSLYINGHLMHIDASSRYQDFYNNVLKTRFTSEKEGIDEPRYWRFSGDKNFQQGLRYEYYHHSDNAPNNENQMDGFFDSSTNGVTFAGSGIHNEDVSWSVTMEGGWFEEDEEETGQYGEKPDYLKNNYFSWKVSGLLYVPVEGKYTFGVDSDDASDVFVDGERVADFYGGHGVRGDYSNHGEEINLEKGYHRFKARLVEGEVNDGISVAWKKPGSEDFYEIPAFRFHLYPSWKFSEVKAQDENQGEMIFDSSGRLRLSGEAGDRVGDDSFDFELDTSVEPPEAFGVIVDTCHNEQDTIGEVKKCDSAEDTLYWQNDISVDGSSPDETKYYVELDRDSPATGDYPDELASALVQASPQDYRAVTGSFGLEAINSNSTRKRLARDILNFLTGPRPKNTNAYAGSDLPQTEVDESKYANSTFDLVSTGFTPQEDVEIVNARFMNSNSSIGLNPVIQEGFENVSEFNSDWDRSEDADSVVTDKCGARKGENAYILKEESQLTLSNELDLSESQDLRAEFWIKVPEFCVDGPESGEDLLVQYSSEGTSNNWVTLREIQHDYGTPGNWYRIKTDPIPEDELDEGFRLRLKKESADYPDAYVIDDLELDSTIDPVPGDSFYSEENITVKAQGLQADKTSFDLSSDPDGINVTYAVQYKDGSRQGYWGTKGKTWIQLDTTPPAHPNFRIERSYTGDSTVNVTVEKRPVPQISYIADLVRFSCDQTEWTDWKKRNDQVGQDFRVDITNPAMGCSSSTGNRTIYGQFRDYAGNMVQEEKSDWVVYDTKKPEFEGVGPANGSTIKLSDPFILNMSDNFSILEGSKTRPGSDQSFENVFNDDDSTEGNESLDVNVSGGLDPFSSEGDRSFVSYVFDKALNVRKNYFEYEVDVTPPSVRSVEAQGRLRGNNTAVKPDDALDFEIDEGNFAEATLNEDGGDGNESFTDDVTFTFQPQWSEGYRLLDIWLRDDAGNMNYTIYNYTVDGTAPVLEKAEWNNGSYILNTTLLAFNFSDQYAGISSFSSLQGAEGSSSYSGWDYEVEPLDDAEGSTSFSFVVEDRAGNSKNFSFEYVIDTVAPNVFSPYTDSGWFSSNTTVQLNATDDNNISTISYCVKNRFGSCTPDKTSLPGQNVSVNVGCEAGKECKKVVRYKANDSAGNVNGTYETEIIRIDKKAPVDSDITGPGSGSTVGGSVDLEADITDSGSGVKDVNYTVYNASNSSQIFDKGDLNASKSYDAVWNSSEDFSAINSVVFNFTAIDKTGNSVELQRQFKVDNSETSVTIRSPYQEYVNESFNLLIEARRPGDRVLEAHSYRIYNPSGDLVEYRSAEGLDAPDHKFNLSVYASDLGADGNYTLNSTATDNESGSATTSTWFVIDTVPPHVSLEGSVNKSWQTGTIDVGYDASDNRKNGSLLLEFKDRTDSSWTEGTSVSYSGTDFQFSTSNCDESSENDCFLRLTAQDAAGNTNSSLLKFKADNSDPSASIDSPPSGKWYNRDFSVNYTVSDNVAPFEELSCESRAGTSAFKSQSCDNQIQVEVGPGDECSEQGSDSCKVEIKVTDKVGLSTSADRRYSVDYEEPKIMALSPQDEYIGESTVFEVNFTDELSGVDYSIWNASGVTKSLINGTEFQPDWNNSGEKTLKLEINDTAGNLLTESRTYTFDNQKPELDNTSLDQEKGLNDEVRIYRGEELKFRANVSDNTKVNKTIVEVGKDSKSNVTMHKTSGSYGDGLWTAEIGSRPETGLYNVSAVYIVDEAGKTRSVSEGLPEFRVVNYSLDLRSGSDVNAGFTGSMTFSLNFNRIQGDKEFDFDFSQPTSESFEVENLTCSYESTCNISQNEDSWTVEANASEKKLNLSLDPREFAPKEDTNITFTTDLKDNARKVNALFRAPNLSITGLRCAQSCTVGQHENFTVEVDALNNATPPTTGKAVEAFLKATNKESGKNYINDIGNISSGSGSTYFFSNLSIPEAGTSDIELVLKDNLTGSYSGFKSLSIQVNDTEKPELLGTSLSSEQITLNESVELEARVEDNEGLGSVNVTLVNSSDEERNLSLVKSSRVDEPDTWQTAYSNTSIRGVYNFTKLYIADENGNYRNVILGETFEAQQLEMNSSVLQNTTTVESPVSFSVNVTGNTEPLSSIELNVSGPAGRNWIKSYESVGGTNTLEYGNFSRSGNYSFEVIANAASSISNKTDNVSVKYGNSTVVNLNGNSSTVVLPEEGPYNFTWDLEPVNGGLRDVDLELSSNDTSVVQPATSSRSIGDLYYDKGVRKVWYRAGLNDPQPGTANLTLTVTPDKGGSSQEEIKVDVRPDDSSPPVIRDVMMGETPLILEQEIGFDVDVTDNSVLENVTLKVSHPENRSNITEEFKMSGEQTGLYSKVFENTSEMGEYNFTVIAWDIAGNKDTYTGSFEVTDELQLELDAGQEVYVMGEEIGFDLSASDAAGQQIRDYNVSATLSKAGSNISLNSGSLGEFSYVIDREDPPARDLNPDLLPVDYTLYLTVEKGPITQNISKEVGVTRLLDNEFMPPDYIEPGSNFTVQVEWTEPYNQEIGALSFTSYAGCTECPPEGDLGFRRMRYNDTTGLYSATFRAPESDSATIQLLGSDTSGNSESQNYAQSVPPTYSVQIGSQGTESNNTGGSGLPSGGFGGGGGPSMQIERVSPPVEIDPDKESVELAVNTNIAAQCVYSPNSIPESVSFSEASNFIETGGVNHSASIGLGDRMTYSYSVMCASESVNATTDIIFSTEDLDSFTFAAPTSLTPGNESVIQFGNRSGRLVVYNDQNAPMDVGFDIEAECCNLSVLQESEAVDSVTLPGGAEANLDIAAYAPLYVKSGTYDGTLYLSSVNDSASHPFSFQVSPHPAVQNYTELRKRAALLNSSISRYRIAGIDTSRMRKAFRNLTGHLEDANGSIQRNDLEGLKYEVERGREDAKNIDSMLEDAALKKYVLLNWWKWAATFVVMYMLFFLVVMVGIPYYRIQTELTRINGRLQRAVEARKKGEKQYFQRKIDKDTFNKMMTERQNEVLELRGEKEDLKEELDGFLWERLTLENYLKAPLKGMEELEKWWAANRRARENLSGGDQDEE